MAAKRGGKKKSARNPISGITTSVRVQDRSQEFFERASTEIEKLIHKTAFRVAIRAARSMNEDTRPPNPPSEPETPPGVITGTLRASLDVESYRDGSNTFVARAGSNLEYARALELGSPSRNLLPRPYLRPAFHAEGLRLGGYDKGGPFGKRLAAIMKKAMGG